MFTQISSNITLNNTLWLQMEMAIQKINMYKSLIFLNIAKITYIKHYIQFASLKN